ncbi:MAG: tetratricopeptide (TPR) repeat protein [Chlamydiales bacterium]|jgi:tetratricopeptide (TPR) repeat protein
MPDRDRTPRARWPWITALTLIPLGVFLYRNGAEQRLSPEQLLPPSAERAANARAVISAPPGAGVDPAVQQARRGRELYEQWRYGEAREALELALELDPEQASVYCDLGLVELRQPGDILRSVALFERAMELDPEDGRFPLGLAGALTAQIMNAGSLLKGAMRLPRIKELLLSSVELAPDDLDSRKALFHFYLLVPGFMGGGAEDAEEQARELGRIDPVEGLIARGTIEHHAKRHEQAETLYRQAVAERSDYGPASQALGLFLIGRERFDDATEAFERRARIDASDPEAHDSLGSCYLKAGRHTLAAASFRRALELNPDSLGARVHLAACLDDMGDETGAEGLYRAVCSRVEEGPWADQARDWLDEHGG